ncbi:Uncharacterized protein PCOAH_00027980 [Plasmodium coatneyi]|uniref:Uncharacterized protein n=1 Tax=Plasmodium coatneyi TaxID=208452 RepID=A0A1B1DZ91_9APIC|nr:Uncharacterized protein PCOAH_00027980 [Plasmodium coatneyi]ANQ08093.1 Uncharacterized protein PCOAH_00027980 [Plasmodium coatneyi]
MEYMNMRRNTPDYATHSYIANLFTVTCKKMSNIMNSSATCLHNFLIQLKNFPSRQSLRSYLVIYNLLLIVFLLFLLMKYRNKCIRTERQDPSQRFARKQVDAPLEEGSSKEEGQSQSRGGSKRRGRSQRRGGNQSRSGSKQKAQITNNGRATSKGRTTSKTRNTGKGRNARKGKKAPKDNQNRNSDLEQEQNVASILNSLRSRARNQKDNIQRENSPINTKRTRRTGLEMTQMNKMVTSNSLDNVSLPYVDISNSHMNLREKEKKRKGLLKEKKKN